MSKDNIELENGKYRIIFESDFDGITHNTEFYAERYGEYWRDLNGDNLIMAMMYEIERLRKIEKVTKEALTSENIFDKMNKFTELKTMLGV